MRVIPKNENEIKKSKKLVTNTSTTIIMKVILKERVSEDVVKQSEEQKLNYIGDDGYVYKYDTYKQKYIRTDLSLNGPI